MQGYSLCLHAIIQPRYNWLTTFLEHVRESVCSPLTAFFALFLRVRVSVRE